jgi:hypothetical protein
LQLHNNKETAQPERSISGPTTVTAQPAQKLWGGGLFSAGQASNVQPLPLLQAVPRLPVATAAAGSILFHKVRCTRWRPRCAWVVKQTIWCTLR